MTESFNAPLDHLVAQYLSLEELAVMEELLELCGASIDTRALPLLERRLHEEEARARALGARGYVRMREKCEQRVSCLRQLIEALEGMDHDSLETQHEWLAESGTTESREDQTAG
jgi:hypothetical protein